MSEKKKREEKDMAAIAKPIKSMEINFDSKEELDKFTKFINNPPEPSDYVKKLIKELRKNKGN